MPWIGNGPVERRPRAPGGAALLAEGVRRRRARSRPIPVGTVAADNIELQLVVANAVYRTGQAPVPRTKRRRMRRSMRASTPTSTVLKNTARHEDAAYNYEYLVRLRDDIDKGKRKPGPGDVGLKGPDGAAGAPPTIESTMSEFKIYIPLESQERQDQGVAGKAGRGEAQGLD